MSISSLYAKHEKWGCGVTALVAERYTDRCRTGVPIVCA